jgi:effector-binding domain-containing protein
MIPARRRIFRTPARRFGSLTNKETGHMNYDVRLEQVQSRPLAVVRRRATKPELARIIPEACGTVWNVVRAQKLRGGRHVTVYFDEVWNVEIGVELDAPFAGDGEVVPSTTPAGTVATTTHLGPYQQLAAAHDAIQQWCKRNGHTPVRPCWEIYGHWQDAWNNDPSQIRTDVYYLIQP